MSLVIAQGFNAAIGFLFLPYLVRALSREQYGSYGQTLMVADTARTIFSMGMSTVLYVNLARSKDQLRDFRAMLGSSVAFGLVGCVLMFGLAGWLASAFHSPELKGLLRIYCFYLPFYLPYLCLNALLIFLGHARASLLLVSMGLILRVLLLVSAVHFTHSLEVVFMSLVGLAVLQLVMALSLVPRDFLKRGPIEPRVALAQVRLGAQLGCIELLGFLLFYVDDFMVSSMLSVQDYATYRTGSFEIPIIGTLYTSIGAIALPMISKFYGEGAYDEIVRVKRKLISSTAAVIYPVIFYLIFFSPTLIATYFSARYTAAAGVFAIMTVGLLFRVTDYYDVLISAGQGRKLIAIYVGAVLFNIAGNAIFIRHFGLLGGAFCLLLTLGIQIPVLFWFSARAIGKRLVDFIDFRKLAIIVTVSGGLPLVLRFVAPASDRIVVALIYGAVSVLISYAVFLKSGVLDYRDLSPLVLKLPKIGPVLDRGLARHLLEEATP